MSNDINFDKFFKGLSQKTIKDIADKYPDNQQEKIVETICPCCKKKLRLKVRM